MHTAPLFSSGLTGQLDHHGLSPAHQFIKDVLNFIQTFKPMEAFRASPDLTGSLRAAKHEYAHDSDFFA
ncbi:hypothetical protein BMS3Abin09_01246 [bacterium BMS3Abin09]|nr:hypothetical protein BMS3Abin09_01246 [bacterium BMS3Abin09]GBE40165.1 hypothetical protein BMS3Bbin09_00038 [bacterium BMS3Bbin09]